MTIPRMAFEWEVRPDFMAAADKRLHALASFGLVLTLCVWHIAPVPACGAVLVLGVAKEIAWDWRLGYGSPEFADICADVIGVLAAFLVLAGA